MKKLANLIVQKNKLFLIVGILLIIPSIIGALATKTNYDILVYLPSDIETLKGQEILKDDFNIGSFAVSIVNNIDDYDLTKIEEKIKKIDCVSEVISINDITGTSIPLDMLPKKYLDKVSKGDSKLLLIIFSTGTSDNETTLAIEEICNMSNNIIVGGMSSMIRDMRLLVDSEMIKYIIVAVICCLIILTISLDSYVVPFILLGNIGIAILYNMGSNILLGEISYITKAIAAVLQLGVTTDFSIFLYHKYETYKSKYNRRSEAMTEAIKDTFVSVIGSSLTTIAGFLALCSMI